MARRFAGCARAGGDCHSDRADSVRVAGGDWKTLGDGVSEVRIDSGPGYRLYYTMREQVVVILLCGSDKRGQDRAIKLAQRLAKDF